MFTRPLKLVTIIVEAQLEDQMLHDLRALRVPGYTCSEVRSEGRHHLRDPFERSHVKIELLVNAVPAEQIVTLLEERYLSAHAIVAWVTDVQAVIA